MNQADLEPPSPSAPTGALKGAPVLAWDLGAAYDLFISLHVLHRPEEFGLRPNWAAGVRSRLPADDRKTLEEADLILPVPTTWLMGLPAPKDSASALWALRQIPAEQRLRVLTANSKTVKSYLPLLHEVAERGAWNEADLEHLRSVPEGRALAPMGKLAQVLDAWANSRLFGERYLQALQSYHQNFFAEEEARILPVLQDALAQAQEQAAHLSALELVEHLSQGLEIQEINEQERIILAPSFWATPLIFFGYPAPRQLFMTFGARPLDASLVPGDTVPDMLLQVLKALADPTRLRILHYLAQEPLTPAELARRLRLRPPTVTHHLNALRMAGLVYILLEKVKDENNRYMARREAIQAMGELLDDFLNAQTTGQV